MTGKIAVITGGSAALHRAQCGTDIVLTYRSGRAEAEAVVREIEAAGRRAVAPPLDTAGFAAFAERLKAEPGRVWDRQAFDFLLNNAGTGIHKSFEATT